MLSCLLLSASCLVLSCHGSHDKSRQDKAGIIEDNNILHIRRQDKSCPLWPCLVLSCLVLGQQHLHDVVVQFYLSLLNAMPTHVVVGIACKSQWWNWAATSWRCRHRICLVLSRPALSSLVICCLIFSCLVVSCLVLSCLALSCLSLPFLALFCLVLSCLVLSSLVSSCLDLSCLVF